MAVALITGAASILGTGIASVLLQDGWDVVLTDISEAGLQLAIGELSHAPQASARRLDVTQRDQVESVVGDIVAKYGAIDALVTAAGGQEGLRGRDGASRGLDRKPFMAMTPAEWDMILDVNLKGTLNACSAVLPKMVAAGRGAIVCVSSGAGLRARPDASIYSAAKAAIIKFVQAVAQEVGTTGVRINCVLPGTTDARWRGADYVSVRPSPMGTPTTARDVGNAVSFLLSERAAHITGSCIDTSGGATLH